MNALKIIGIVLVVIGLVSLVFQGIDYTTQETVVELGPVEMSARENKRIPLPPIFGALLLIGGVAAFILGSRNKP